MSGSPVPSRLNASAKGSGPDTIVLLHGFGGNHANWTDIQADLARQAQVIAYDLPGHGRSLDAAGAGNASAMAKAVIADLEERGVKRAHFAGFSMGGAVATLAGLRAPTAVASLTLVAPGGFGPEINQQLMERLASADGGTLRKVMDDMSGPGFATLNRDIAGALASQGAPGQRDRLRQIVAMIARDGRQGEIPREMLATLAMPVTVIWGDADPVLPYKHARGLPPNIQLETLPGKGHMLLNEARRTVAAAIRRTVRQASGK